MNISIRLLMYVWVVVCILASCKTSQTALKHGNEFSNIRSEIALTDGTRMMGYATYNAARQPDKIEVYLPAERKHTTLMLQQIEKLKADEHEFVVRYIKMPDNSANGRNAMPVRAMVKRVGMEQDAVQVYEYKYPVVNPKSPLQTLQTGYWVAFPGDTAATPLVWLGSEDYRRKWNTWYQLAVAEMPATGLSAHAPANMRHLMQEIRKIPLEQAANSTTEVIK